MRELIDKLAFEHSLTFAEWVKIIDSDFNMDYLFEKAREVRNIIYGNTVYTRGLIEISSYCKNDCFYCGIRCGNEMASRYRLTKEQILDCCKNGYELGFRTFVLQGGEDLNFTKERVADIVKTIKDNYPDCAVTLSLGEKDYETYKTWKDAGADRYLLRHETADEKHYKLIHPTNMSYENRIRCLQDLKNLGYQVGCGFMVQSPYQDSKCLAKDMEFICKFRPDMVGIGPFIPHKDTPFKEEEAGTLELTLKMIALIRLAIPNCLLPATTALGTINQNGREMGILAGANVVMPNLSPTDVREKYSLYDNKICTGDEAAECRSCLSRRMENIGYKLTIDRGDIKSY